MGNSLSSGNNKILLNNSPVTINAPIFGPPQSLSPAFEKLYSKICASAFHNSDNYDETKCHEDTRVAILSLLEEWALSKTLNTQDGITPMIWLHGAAGVGKTAIAKSLAERLEALGKLSASFFFWMADPGRSDDTNLVSTLAFQLAQAIPPIRLYIEAVIASDPAIFDRTGKSQVDALIIKPLLLLRNHRPDIDVSSLPNVIIIDGLDECGGISEDRVRSQKRAFDILHALASHQSLFPFKILVISRDNNYISGFFKSPHSKDISRSILLEAGYVPISDIELYIEAQLNAIRVSHPDRHSLPAVWPKKNVTHLIASSTEGQFVIAAIAMRFIADVHRRPQDQLDIVLGAITSDFSRDNSKIFMPLYALYRQVIDSVIEESRKKAFEVVQFYIAHTSSSGYYSNMCMPDVERYLGINTAGGLWHCLRGFEAIFKLQCMQGPTGEEFRLQFRHSTFIDFLFDKQYAGDWFVDIGVVKEKFAMMDMAMFAAGPVEGKGWLREYYAENATAIWRNKWAKFPEYDAGLLFLQRSGRQAGAHVNSFMKLLNWNKSIVEAFCVFLEPKMKPYEEHGLLYTLLLSYAYDSTVPFDNGQPRPAFLDSTVVKQVDWSSKSYSQDLRACISSKLQRDDKLCAIDRHNLQLLDSPHDNPSVLWLLTMMPLFYSAEIARSEDQPMDPDYCLTRCPPMGKLSNNEALLRAKQIIQAEFGDETEPKLRNGFGERGKLSVLSNIYVSLAANREQRTVAYVNSDVEGLRPPTPPTEAEVILVQQSPQFHLLFTTSLDKNRRACGFECETAFMICEILGLNGIIQAFEKLYSKICATAFHNSDTYEETKCHPGTRVSILNLLEEWALSRTLNTQDGMTPMIWLHGAAGIGKTAIAKSLAERLEGLGRLSASFFFWMADPGRSDDRSLVATIAFQLARSIPPIRSYIEHAIASDPAIFDRTGKSQVDALILKPLRLLRDSNPDLDVHSLPNIIIIDGLDECGGRAQDRVHSQKRVLDILHLMASQQALFPFRFLVISREDGYIRGFFEESHMTELSRFLLLDDGFVPISDIELYIAAQFNAIKTSHPDKDALPKSPEVWPDKAVPRLMAVHMNGQFIMAATAMKFIADVHRRPNEQLGIVLNALESDFSESEENSNVFTPLFTLYRQVIDSVIEESRKVAFEVVLFHIAHIHISPSGFYSYIRVADVEKALRLPAGGLRHCIRGFEAIFGLQLVQGTTVEEHRLKFQHSTFIDFIFDRQYAGDWYVDLGAVKEKFATLDMAMFEKSKARSIEEQTYWFYCLCNALLPVVEIGWFKNHFAEAATTIWRNKWANFPKYDAGLLFLRRSGSQAGAHVYTLLRVLKWDKRLVASFCAFLEAKMKPYEEHALLYGLLLTYVYDSTIPLDNGQHMIDKEAAQEREAWSEDSYGCILRRSVSHDLRHAPYSNLRAIDHHNLRLLESPHDNPDTSWVLTIMPIFYSAELARSEAKPLDPACYGTRCPPLGNLPNNQALLRAVNIFQILAFDHLKWIQERRREERQVEPGVDSKATLHPNYEAQIMEREIGYGFGEGGGPITVLANIVISLVANREEGMLALLNSETYSRRNKRHLSRYFDWIQVVEGPPTTPPTERSEITNEGFEKLYNHICASAFHNSDEYDETKCHPGTRISILSLLEEWAVSKTLSSDDGITPMVWLHGAAGVGKTAIAKSFAERLEGIGRLAATFFFWRSDQGRSDDRNLVATLAYQLTQSIPAIRSYIEDAISSDPAIFSRTPTIQVDTLILKPLRLMRDIHPDLDVHALPNVLIIDALDECGGLNHKRVRSQKRAFDTLHALASNQSLFPFRILVLSRINQHIRMFFEGQGMKDMSRSILLEAGLVPISDIELYINAQFNAIKTSHPDKDSLPDIWPEKGTAMHIAESAQGQFIFAATVMAFIADSHHQPKEQLKIVLDAIVSDFSGRESTVFKPLYGVYRQVIDSVIEESRRAAFDVVSFHIAHTSLLGISTHIRIPFVEDLLGLPAGGLRHCLRDFEAIFGLELVEGKEREEVYRVRFKHSTFVDFVFDKAHAGDWYVDIAAVKEKYGMMDMAMFERCKASSIEDQTFWFYAICNALLPVSEQGSKEKNPAELATDEWRSRWANFPQYEAGLLFLQRSERWAGAQVALLLHVLRGDNGSGIAASFCSFLEMKMKPYEDDGLLYTLLLTHVYDTTIPIGRSQPWGIIPARTRSESQDGWTTESFCSFIRKYISAQLHDKVDLVAIDQNSTSLRLLDLPHDNPDISWLLTMMPLFYLVDFPGDSDPWGFSDPRPPLGNLPNDGALLRAAVVIGEIESHCSEPSPEDQLERFGSWCVCFFIDFYYNSSY
ncbi:hypothetical protein CVT24_002665 [Panaeolus cyanescens]|uniref:Nephrocystin 3-like N-terminal domain-containing protein n=1 Tax=Panaeolus cyanescens TaxID=181874 RepID=A0A409YU05_9AGAR|nr:hypothetical protein CVT24_002665 [Panaeolus cyanescens]